MQSNALDVNSLHGPGMDLSILLWSSDMHLLRFNWPDSHEYGVNYTVLLKYTIAFQVDMKPRDRPSNPSSFTGRISTPRGGARERLKSCGKSHLTCTYTSHTHTCSLHPTTNDSHRYPNKPTMRPHPLSRPPARHTP